MRFFLPAASQQLEILFLCRWQSSLKKKKLLKKKLSFWCAILFKATSIFISPGKRDKFQGAKFEKQLVGLDQKSVMCSTRMIFKKKFPKKKKQTRRPFLNGRPGTAILGYFFCVYLCGWLPIGRENSVYVVRIYETTTTLLPSFSPFWIGCENSGSSSRERRRQDEKAKPTDPSCCLTHNNSRTEEASPPLIVVRVSAGQKIPSLHHKKKKKHFFILF